jgi:hypothetical protein
LLHRFRLLLNRRQSPQLHQLNPPYLIRRV